jgi:hypothetical protein
MRVRIVRLGLPVISPQNLSPAFERARSCDQTLCLPATLWVVRSGHTVDPLLGKEVVNSVHTGNKKVAFCSGFVGLR